MADGKGLASTNIQGKIDDLKAINALHGAYGDLAFRVAKRHHTSAGYTAGVERLEGLLGEGRFDPEGFARDPVAGVEEWLRGFFADRGGNQPEIWSEGRTVFLRTPACRTCLVVEAEKRVPPSHPEVCFVYCRAWAFGYVKVLEDLHPEIVVHYHNVDSRRKGPEHDCTEAFQVVTARR